MFGRRRDERSWDRVQRQLTPFAIGAVADRPTLVVVCGVRQRAGTGLKAYLSFPPEAGLHAAWFPRAWPPTGHHLVVRGHFWTDVDATHHGEEVFWVDAIVDSVDASIVRGWRRHQRRLARRRRASHRATDPTTPS